MRGVFSFLITIVVIALLVIIVGWIFATDFFLLDALMIVGLLALQIALWVGLPILVIIGIIWIIKELF
jgi:hypothetical protein